MRHIQKTSRRTATHHKTKTHVVTNTQLALAVAAAFLAGGLAYMVTPRGVEMGPNSCRVSSINFVERCNGANYKGAEFTCSNGIQGEIPVSRYCRNTKKLRKMVAQLCADEQCVPAGNREENLEEKVEEVPVPPEASRVQNPIIEEINPNACELRTVQFEDRCGHNQYQKVQVTCSDGSLVSPSVSCQSVGKLQEFAALYCASLDCSPIQNIPSSKQNNTDTSNQNTTNTDVTKSMPKVPVSAPVLAPVLAPVVPEAKQVKLQIQGSPIAKIVSGKLYFEMTLLNKGNADASSDSKYTLVFTDEKGNVLSRQTLTLGAVLKINEKADFATTLALIPHAAFIRVFIDPAFADLQKYDVTIPMPAQEPLKLLL